MCVCFCCCHCALQLNLCAYEFCFRSLHTCWTSTNDRNALMLYNQIVWRIQWINDSYNYFMPFTSFPVYLNFLIGIGKVPWMIINSTTAKVTQNKIIIQKKIIETSYWILEYDSRCNYANKSINIYILFPIPRLISLWNVNKKNSRPRGSKWTINEVFPTGDKIKENIQKNSYLIIAEHWLFHIDLPLIKNIV